MREYPINYLDELIGQSNSIAEKFHDYTSFSYATVEDILDSAILSRMDHTFYANTAAHHIIWNNGGTFNWEKLPELVQVSPLKHTIVRDFNHDSYPDVLLAGNDHSYDIGTGYYDASKGFVLLSNADKPLTDLLTPSKSGMVLNGMVESLLYLEGDTPLIMVGFNRDSVRIFTLNN
jgi:hypothetical protein